MTEVFDYIEKHPCDYYDGNLRTYDEWVAHFKEEGYKQHSHSIMTKFADSKLIIKKFGGFETLTWIVTKD